GFQEQEWAWKNKPTSWLFNVFIVLIFIYATNIDFHGIQTYQIGDDVCDALSGA
ncbi:hypothetical protein MKX03_018288, partial [Papaver bracteatum]